MARTRMVGIDLAGFWRTSAHRACLARRIASTLDPASQMEAFTAGLLQDMAIPVLAAAHGERYTALYRRSETAEPAETAEPPSPRPPSASGNATSWATTTRRWAR